MISTVAFGYLLTFTNLQNVFAKTRIIFASKVKPLDLFSEHAKIESPLYAFKRLWKKVSGLSTYDGAKSSGTEIFEGRLCMNSADGWLILLSMLQSLTWEASFYYSEQVENQSKQLHVWHHSEAKLISKFMSSIHIQGIR
ncbi:hypothetical protein T4C_7383 [Trichinella pseudospiralis]|uniref:Uncharacterized protein n=1 Tax=Trichinella pseudospiralis TaxID=6337 RepID=A0A0V1K8M6_TRIPS|nr:hypothetical protein T4C_7383 [Trichinella pseudospiralis]